PLSVTTNLVRAEAFVNDPIWFRLSLRADEAFGSRSYCRQLFRASGTVQSLRTAPSLARKTTLGRQVTFRGCALRCSTVIWWSSPPESGWGLSRSVMPRDWGFYLAVPERISAS